MVAAVAFTDGFTGEGFSGEDFVTALTMEMYFSGSPLGLFDFDLKGQHLVQRLPILHAVAPAEGIAAVFAGETPLDDITRSEGTSGLILAAHDVPLWFRLIHNDYIINSWPFVNHRATDVEGPLAAARAAAHLDRVSLSGGRDGRTRQL